MFEKQLIAGWGDMDFNSHMRNTAFLDKSADVRMMFFAEHGFPTEEFVRRQIGPVVRKDEIEYFKEIRLLEEFRVTLAIAGLAEDGSRFLLRTSSGGPVSNWRPSHQCRRLARPRAPQTGDTSRGLLAALRSLP